MGAGGAGRHPGEGERIAGDRELADRAGRASVHDIVPAAEVVRRMAAEAVEVMQRAAASLE